LSDLDAVHAGVLRAVRFLVMREPTTVESLIRSGHVEFNTFYLRVQEHGWRLPVNQRIRDGYSFTTEYLVSRALFELLLLLVVLSLRTKNPFPMILSLQDRSYVRKTSEVAILNPSPKILIFGRHFLVFGVLGRTS